MMNPPLFAQKRNVLGNFKEKKRVLGFPGESERFYFYDLIAHGGLLPIDKGKVTSGKGATSVKSY